MNKLLTILSFILLFANGVNAQERVYSSSGKPLNKSQKNVKSDKLINPDRVIFGGWGVFGIGNGVLNLGITPILGYRITDNFSAGIGLGYQYLWIKEGPPVFVSINPSIEEPRPLNAHLYSPSIWARHIIWNNIFAHAEYEHNISSQTYYINDHTQYATRPIIKESNTVSVPSLLVGGGLRQPIGGRASMIFMILYDVLQEPNSPYANTVAIRFGINFGF